MSLNDPPTAQALFRLSAQSVDLQHQVTQLRDQLAALDTRTTHYHALASSLTAEYNALLASHKSFVIQSNFEYNQAFMRNMWASEIIRSLEPLVDKTQEPDVVRAKLLAWKKAGLEKYPSIVYEDNAMNRDFRDRTFQVMREAARDRWRSEDEGEETEDQQLYLTRPRVE